MNTTDRLADLEDQLTTLRDLDMVRTWRYDCLLRQADELRNILLDNY